MIDNGKYTTHYSTPEAMLQVLSQSQIFYEGSFKNSHSGEEVHTYKFHNLIIKARITLCEIEINGSLTKLINGNNYTNLNYSSLNYAIHLICELLKKQPQEIKIHRLEYALVINTPSPPLKYLPYFLRYKQKELFYQMPPSKSSIPLLKHCSLDQYRIKIYDTGTWNDLPTGSNLLKFEVSFKRSQKLIQILKQGKPITLSHLLIPENIVRLGDFALEAFELIDIKVTPSQAYFNSLSNKNRRLLFAGEFSDYWQLERTRSPFTFKRDRKEYAKIKNQLKASNANPIIDLSNSFRNLKRSLEQN